MFYISDVDFIRIIIIFTLVIVVMISLIAIKYFAVTSNNTEAKIAIIKIHEQPAEYELDTQFITVSKVWLENKR